MVMMRMTNCARTRRVGGDVWTHRVARTRRRALDSSRRDAQKCVCTVARVVERGSVTSSGRDATRRDERRPNCRKVNNRPGRPGTAGTSRVMNRRVTIRGARDDDDDDHSSSSVAESFNIFLYSSGSSHSASIDALSEQNSCSRRSSRFLSSNFCEHFSPPKPRLK